MSSHALSDPAQRLKDEGDGAGMQPTTRSSGGDLVVKTVAKIMRTFLNHPWMKIEPIKQQWKMCRGGAVSWAEQSGNEDEQVVDDDTLSQRSEPMSQDTRKHYSLWEINAFLDETSEPVSLSSSEVREPRTLLYSVQSTTNWATTASKSASIFIF